MDRRQAKEIATAVATLMKGVKAVHVMPKITGGVVNIRVYSYPTSPDEPEPFVFTWEELM